MLIHTAHEVTFRDIVRVENHERVESVLLFPQDLSDAPHQNRTFSGLRSVRTLIYGDKRIFLCHLDSAVRTVICQKVDMPLLLRIILVFQAFQQMCQYFFFISRTYDDRKAVHGLAVSARLFFPYKLNGAEKCYEYVPADEYGRDHL